jgi:hypothetical protein
MDWKNTPEKIKKDVELAQSLHPNYDLETASWITKKKSKRVGKKTPKLPKNTPYNKKPK